MLWSMVSKAADRSRR